MSKAALLGIVAAMSVAMVGPTGTALAAKKKLTYEQAWAECKKDVAFLGSDAATSAGRYTRGAACMKEHGYRLKKSSM